MYHTHATVQGGHLIICEGGGGLSLDKYCIFVPTCQPILYITMDVTTIFYIFQTFHVKNISKQPAPAPVKERSLDK
jgi:hypothetical protein